MRPAERAGRAFDRLLDVCAWIGCGLLAFQVVSVSTEVICRSFFDISFSLITPLNEWSLVYLTFLGVAWLQREGGHTSDDSIAALLPAEVNRAAKWFGWMLAVATCALLTWYGALATWDNYSKDAYDYFKLREVPVFYVYLIIPVGSLLWLIQLLRRQSWPISAPAAATDDRGGDV
jgi:TRAP-type C4-dicarboxylate transport system permease small subunit